MRRFFGVLLEEKKKNIWGEGGAPPPDNTLQGGGGKGDTLEIKRDELEIKMRIKTKTERAINNRTEIGNLAIIPECSWLLRHKSEDVLGNNNVKLDSAKGKMFNPVHRNSDQQINDVNEID